MKTTIEKLEAIRNYSTRYELIITKGDSRLLLGYTSQKSRSGMMKVIYAYGEELVKFTGSESFTNAKKAADGATIGEYAIRFSGRTQRDAIIEGELSRFTEDQPATPPVTTAPPVPANSYQPGFGF